jgi:hypothetical protein
MTGLWEDPLEALAFASYCDDPNDTDIDCEGPLDKNFPIDLDMVDTLVEICVKELIGVFNQSIEDRSNDGNDSPTEQTK